MVMQSIITKTDQQTLDYGKQTINNGDNATLANLLATLKLTQTVLLKSINGEEIHLSIGQLTQLAVVDISHLYFLFMFITLQQQKTINSDINQKIKTEKFQNISFNKIKEMGIINTNPTVANNVASNKPQQNKAFYQGQCDDQGRHHGKGVMKYSDGSVFDGNFIKGLPSFGLFKYPNGNSYNGELKDNKPNGQGQWIQQKGVFIGQFENGNFIKGEIKYSDGSFFRGSMVDMKKDGQQCFYKFKDGDLFQGEFKNDHFHRGKYVSKDKDLQYEGLFNEESQKHGQGKLILRGVAEYQGLFANDQFDGEGTLRNLKTSIKYQGNFKQGKKHGQGKLFGQDDKIIYEGEFYNNQKDGKGTFYHQKKKYEGDFVGGKFEGVGSLYYGDGDSYKGGFKDNKKHGKGELILVNNSIRSYLGDFVEDKFEGSGQVIYSNGDIYKGGFRMNKKHGKGLYVLEQNKTVFEGEWKDDIKDGYFIQTSEQKGLVIKGPYKNGEKHGDFIITNREKEAPPQTWVEGKKNYN